MPSTPTLSALVPHPHSLQDTKRLQRFTLTFGGQRGRFADTKNTPRGISRHVAIWGGRSPTTYSGPGASREISHHSEADGIPKAVPQNVVTDIRPCTAGLRVLHPGARRELEGALEQSTEGPLNTGSYGGREAGEKRIVVDVRK